MTVGIDLTPLLVRPYTGVQIIVAEATRALIENRGDHRLKLFVIGPRQAVVDLAVSWRDLPSGVSWHQLKLPARWFHRVASRWQAWQWPAIESFLGKLSIWHSFDWFAFPALAKRTATVFDLTPLVKPEWHQEANVEAFLARNRCLSRMATLMALSRTTAADIKSLMPEIDPKKVEIIYPGLPKSFLVEDSGLRKKVGTKMTRPGYFLAVARVDPRKNYERLLQAYLLSRKKYGVKRPLVIVGNVEKEIPGLKGKRAKDQGIDYRGFVANAELPQIYQRAWAFLYPSLYEGFGLPIIEAMGAGTVVMTSVGGAMAEVGGTAACYCEPLRVEAMAKTIAEIDQMSKDKRQKLIAGGKMRARGYSFERMAKEMYRVWESLGK